MYLLAGDYYYEDTERGESLRELIIDALQHGLVPTIANRSKKYIEENFSVDDFVDYIVERDQVGLIAEFTNLQLVDERSTDFERYWLFQLESFKMNPSIIRSFVNTDVPHPLLRNVLTEMPEHAKFLSMMLNNKYLKFNLVSEIPFIHIDNQQSKMLLEAFSGSFVTDKEIYVHYAPFHDMRIVHMLTRALNQLL